jgi:RNA polymerase sigma-70 factor (ECF subfamily)
MDANRTTAAIQGYLDELNGLHGDSPAEPVVRSLLERSAGRLHQLCATLLYRSYPRLTRAPANLQSDEMLSAVVERLMKALREARPGNVRQFFKIANQHMRWELNDVARRLDGQMRAVEIVEEVPAGPETSASQLSPVARRMFAAIDELPEDEREAFELVKIQGMTQVEAADMLGVSDRTVLRRLNRALLLLTQKLGDLRPVSAPPDEKSGEAGAAEL